MVYVVAVVVDVLVAVVLAGFGAVVVLLKQAVGPSMICRTYIVSSDHS